MTLLGGHAMTKAGAQPPPQSNQARGSACNR